MLIYHVQLIHPETKQVMYEAFNEKPLLPPLKGKAEYEGCILVINTLSSYPEDNKKRWPEAS